ncbi:Segregation and condensation protein A [Candidatus Protochlamydia amoebophila]|uniref:segregation and condensation protein A n=1 Tax=Candidatus Protochlamydia amoebophila TaxID=362787 RepID=UPI001BC99ED8|nr:segregation/condensation protein A [Candidatus Protochlamydia amoebophila]MBS4164475.1 Segregation and condensation protein A [Candidatus Protochlamydia amoebophila]
MIQTYNRFSLENFEGPLEFLLSLIQKEEINIYDVSIQELTQQFLEKLKEWETHYLEKGAEFVGSASYLVWLKSKMLLPIEEPSLEAETVQEDPHFEIIHHLLDYCRFKQAAKELSARQDKQLACYFRGASENAWKKPLGLKDISLEELSILFKEITKRAERVKGKILEENWRVSDKIRFIKLQLQKQSSFRFDYLFLSDMPRLELIVIFLAILELMKIGSIGIGKNPESQVLVYLKQKDDK